MKTYKELIAWQKGIELVLLAYKITQKFPKEELYALADQIKRSSVSIPSNIAEGFGRHSDNDFIRFLNISRGSLFELQHSLKYHFALILLNQKIMKLPCSLQLKSIKCLML